jgi:hypothetical protein
MGEAAQQEIYVELCRTCGGWKILVERKGKAGGNRPDIRNQSASELQRMTGKPIFQEKEEQDFWNSVSGKTSYSSLSGAARAFRKH